MTLLDLDYKECDESHNTTVHIFYRNRDFRALHFTELLKTFHRIAI